MSEVRLADIYNPKTFAAFSQEAQIQKNRFLQSGIMAQDPVIANMLAQGGNLGEITHFPPLSTGEPNYSTDDPADKSTPEKIGSRKQGFRLASRNNSWSAMDLARELALTAAGDPVAAITGRIGSYWASDDEKRLIYSLMGVLNNNVSANGGDMVNSVALATGAITDANRISPDVVIDTKQTLGDHADTVAAIAFHSAIFSRLQKQNVIQTIPASNSQIAIATYLGYRVIVDDSLAPVVPAGGTNPVYTAIMFGTGSVGYANGKVQTPSESKRDPDAGNGGGQDTIFSRVANVIHPYGFNFTSTSVAKQTATYQELATASNWARVYDRKHIPLAFLQVNL